jgi:pimeloyl-ACP methyl ester carboxylesterase
MPDDAKIRLSSGGDVAVRTAGDPSRPALVLLHGFPSSSRTFRDVIGSLSRSVYVVAPDLPGFGASDLPPELSFDSLARSPARLKSYSRVSTSAAGSSTCMISALRSRFVLQCRLPSSSKA